MSIPNTTKFSFNVSRENIRPAYELLKKFRFLKSNEPFTLEIAGMFSLPNVLSLESVNLEMPDLVFVDEFHETQEPAVITLTLRQVPITL